MINHPSTDLNCSFGHALQDFLYQPRIFSILGEEGTWSAGGCWILADALRQLLGPQARLKMIASEKSSSEHVVVEFGTRYIHATGMMTKAEFLREMREGEGILHPRLVAFDSRALRQNGVPAPGIKSRRLLRALRRRFGSRPLKATTTFCRSAL